MMLSIGMFQFEIGTLAYQDLQRRTDWKHARTARVGARDANQFVGPGQDSINLSGYILPEFAGDIASLQTLRDMASGGEAWPLVTGTGQVLGAFVIDAIDERQALFFADGTPRRIEFTVDMHVVDS